MSDLAVVAAVAAATTLLTLGLVSWIFVRILSARVERLARRRLDQLKLEIEEELDRHLDRVRLELGDEIQQRVRTGVVEGFAALPTAEGLRATTRSVVRSGADLVGLGGLLRRPDPDDG